MKSADDVDGGCELALACLMPNQKLPKVTAASDYTPDGDKPISYSREDPLQYYCS